MKILYKSFLVLSFLFPFCSFAQGAWTRKANFGGMARDYAVDFSIGTKGYIGTGADAGGKIQDFWEWNGDISSPAYNTWIQKTNFGGTARDRAVGFSIGTKGYIGTGNDGIFKKDFWEYDPSSDEWTQKTNFGGTARTGAFGFSIGTKGYIGVGLDGSPRQDFWEWDQTTDTWMQKADFGGGIKLEAIGFSIGTKGYAGTGRSTGSMQEKDFWEYDPAAAGVNDINNRLNISVFPNPSSGKLQLAVDNMQLVRGRLEIYNVFGEKILSQKLQTAKSEIDLSNQPNGIYFLTIKTNQGTANQKLIIQK